MNYTAVRQKLFRIYGGKGYCITVSPPPQPDHLIEEIHMKTIYKLLGHKFILFPEFDDNGRWHYHGLILEPKINVLEDDFKGFAFIKIERPKNFDNWFAYITKDYTKMRGMHFNSDQSKTLKLDEFEFDILITKVEENYSNNLKQESEALRSDYSNAETESGPPGGPGPHPEGPGFSDVLNAV